MSAVIGAAAPAVAGWHGRHLLLAPHRLAFFLAGGMLALSGTWWAAVQLAQAGVAPALPWALPPVLAHAAVMSFGFLPLFFAGFLFTAGPRWLAVPPPGPRVLAWPLGLQCGGWLAWLAGAHLAPLLATAGAGLGALGVAAVALRLAAMVRASRMPDRLHARIIVAALAACTLCEAGVAAAVASGELPAARAFVLCGLWSGVVPVFIAAGHRMVPFFGAGALPWLDARRPQATLVLMLGMAAFEAACPWVELAGGGSDWMVLRGFVEQVAGGLLLALAIAWGFFKHLGTRFLAMLHLGFAWLGLSFVLAGAARLLAAVAGHPVLPLAGLHALTMGCLGSLLLVMASRVACGHGGRPRVDDGILWTLFLLLQAAVLLRLAAAAVAQRGWPMAAAAVLWAGIMGAWSMRHARWYGRPRPDGRPG